MQIEYQDGFEVYSVELVKNMKREVLELFPSSLSKEMRVHAVITLQRATIRMEDWDEEVENEKDRLLHQVLFR